MGTLRDLLVESTARRGSWLEAGMAAHGRLVVAMVGADMSDSAHSLRVFYDSACPLCRREIAFYQRLDRNDLIAWLDLHAADVDPSVSGISHEQALGRLYAVERDGRVFGGARAFAAIWRRVPGFRALGAVVGRPPTVWIAEFLYRLFLRVRPGISRMLSRLEQASRSPGR